VSAVLFNIIFPVIFGALWGGLWLAIAACKRYFL
jgi:hypothetical protein